MCPLLPSIIAPIVLTLRVLGDNLLSNGTTVRPYGNATPSLAKPTCLVVTNRLGRVPMLSRNVLRLTS